MREGVFMFKKVTSCAVFGIDGRIIGVEADVSDGLPIFAMVGYLSSSVKESSERVRTALKNSNIFLPPKRITINLTPANIRKDGSAFDLPIAASLLMCLGIEPKFSLEDTVIIGELGLDGQVRPVPGVLPMLCHCFEQGFKSCIIPYENVNEAMLIKGLKVKGIKSLDSLKDFFLGETPDFSGIGGSVLNPKSDFSGYQLDFSEIKGQETLKRGIEIAAAGFHNVLMTGAAGAGKSMIAKRLPTIMPKLSFEESIEVTKIFSVNGLLLDNSRLVSERPFRAPHHTVSATALVGGGSIPKPGEVSLAHNGVLFLDELPEFSKNALEVLRQPIEDRKITISRVNATYVFPSDFMLVAAMNPCPCGNFPNRNKCSCSPYEIKHYQNKISGPLMDRIDINMEVKPLSYEDIFEEKAAESSSVIRARVEKALEIQKKRYADDGLSFNSQLEGKLLKKYITLSNECEDILKNTYQTSDLSARGVYRILRLSRTIADLEGNEDITVSNLREAIFYRNSANELSEDFQMNT
jgi:magnesium chelatase family protein